MDNIKKRLNNIKTGIKEFIALVRSYNWYRMFVWLLSFAACILGFKFSMSERFWITDPRTFYFTLPAFIWVAFTFYLFLRRNPLAEWLYSIGMAVIAITYAPPSIDTMPKTLYFFCFIGFLMLHLRWAPLYSIAVYIGFAYRASFRGPMVMLEELSIFIFILGVITLAFANAKHMARAAAWAVSKIHITRTLAHEMKGDFKDALKIFNKMPWDVIIALLQTIPDAIYEGIISGNESLKKDKSFQKVLKKHHFYYKGAFLDYIQDLGARIEAALGLGRAKLESMEFVMVKREGGWQPEPKTIDIVPIIRKETRYRRFLFEDDGLALEVSLPEEPVFAWCDPMILANVIRNMLRNAWQYSRNSGSKVSITVTQEAADVIIKITDDGNGISEEDLAKLGKRRVVRVGDTTSTSGTGIGFTSSQEDLEAIGGSLELTSPGRGLGATATIHLPID
jgi:signal transduction histidine kinase